MLLLSTHWQTLVGGALGWITGAVIVWIFRAFMAWRIARKQRDKKIGAESEMKSEYASEEEYRAVPWRCFHCDETFTTPGGAADHFGKYVDSIPGCILKVQLGDERGWLMELRRLQEENAHLREQLNEEYWD